MKITVDHTTNTAFVQIESVPNEQRTIVLDEDVIVFTDLDEQPWLIETLDTARWGTPFDDEAARKLHDWVRSRISPGAAA